jgi:hypothetical protein
MSVSQTSRSTYPTRLNNGAAALVFPGGGYIRLAYNIEGTEVCDWINSLGMTCVLVKYRVPEEATIPKTLKTSKTHNKQCGLLAHTPPSGTLIRIALALLAFPQERTSLPSSARIPTSRERTFPYPPSTLDPTFK